MLLGYFDIDFSKCKNALIDNSIIETNLFKEDSFILSDNSKDLVAQILVESDEKVINSKIDFDGLALKLMELYPKGNKPGTTYPWRGSLGEIAYKLRVIVARYNAEFTEQEAIDATKEYVSSFKAPYQFMHTLKNFLLYTKKDSEGHYEMESLFMTIIENKRE